MATGRGELNDGRGTDPRRMSRVAPQTARLMREGQRGGSRGRPSRHDARDSEKPEDGQDNPVGRIVTVVGRQEAEFEKPENADEDDAGETRSAEEVPAEQEQRGHDDRGGWELDEEPLPEACSRTHMTAKRRAGCLDAA